MEPPKLSGPEPLRRSTRNCNKVEAEEKNSKYDPDSVSDPRERIRNLELLEKLNEFLWDIGTDPDQIDINLDLSCSSNQARVLYVPRLEEDIEQSVMDTEGHVQADDVKPALPEVISTPTNDQNAVNEDVDELTQVCDFDVPIPEGDNDQSSVPENKETELADVKPDLPPPQEVILATTNDQNAGEDGFETPVESIVKVEVEEDQNGSVQISMDPMMPRGRNLRSNCVTS